MRWVVVPACLQWFKGYWDDVTGGQEIADYDAAGRRTLCKTGDWRRVRLQDLLFVVFYF